MIFAPPSSKIQRFASTIAFCSLLLAIATSSWNSPVAFDFFRLNDLFIIFAFIVTTIFFGINYKILVAILSVLVLILLSLISSVHSAHILELDRLAFIYKYIFPLLVIGVLINEVNSERRIDLINKAIFFLIIILLLWPYLYNIYIRETVTEFRRIAMPGSLSKDSTDAHLYGVLLSSSLLFYTLYLRRFWGHGFVLPAIITGLSIGCFLYTGSKSVVAVLLVAFSVYTYLQWKRGELVPLIAKCIGLLFCFISIYILLFIIEIHVLELGFVKESLSAFEHGLDRITSFSNFDDQSSLDRVAKFKGAFDEFSRSELGLGSGILASSQDWYDSLLSILLAHLGFIGPAVLIGLVLWINYLYLHYDGNREIREISASFIIFISYFFANLITEYVLVTRSALPTITMIIVPLLDVRLNSRLRSSWRVKN